MGFCGLRISHCHFPIENCKVSMDFLEGQCKVAGNLKSLKQKTLVISKKKPQRLFALGKTQHFERKKQIFTQQKIGNSFGLHLHTNNFLVNSLNNERIFGFSFHVNLY